MLFVLGYQIINIHRIMNFLFNITLINTKYYMRLSVWIDENTNIRGNKITMVLKRPRVRGRPAPADGQQMARAHENENPSIEIEGLRNVYD